MEPDEYTLEIEGKPTHLSARVGGVRTRESVTAMTLEIFEAAIDRQHASVLIDVRGLQGQLGPLDSYRVVTEVFQQIRGRGLRKAAVVDRPMRPTREWFLETVARNRGFNFRVFPDLESAIRWLED